MCGGLPQCHQPALLLRSALPELGLPCRLQEASKTGKLLDRVAELSENAQVQQEVLRHGIRVLVWQICSPATLTRHAPVPPSAASCKLLPVFVCVYVNEFLIYTHKGTPMCAPNPTRSHEEGKKLSILERIICTLASLMGPVALLRAHSCPLSRPFLGRFACHAMWFRPHEGARGKADQQELHILDGAVSHCCRNMQDAFVALSSICSLTC